jgi:hypothetical protein
MFGAIHVCPRLMNVELRGAVVRRKQKEEGMERARLRREREAKDREAEQKRIKEEKRRNAAEVFHAHACANEVPADHASMCVHDCINSNRKKIHASTPCETRKKAHARM